MLDHLRTLLAQLIVYHLLGPRSLLVAAWGWLAADTDDLDEKRRCLEAILELEPYLEWAQTALRGMGPKQPLG